MSPHYAGNDRYRIEQAAAMAAAASLPLMATNDVLYHAAEQRPLQDVVTAIRLNVPVAEAGFELASNAERHLKPPAEMARLFRRYPQALAETLRFAAKPRFLAAGARSTIIPTSRPNPGCRRRTSSKGWPGKGPATAITTPCRRRSKRCCGTSSPSSRSSITRAIS